MVEEGTTGILPLMVEDQAIQHHVNKCGCVYEVGRGEEVMEVKDVTGILLLIGADQAVLHNVNKCGCMYV